MSEWNENPSEIPATDRKSDPVKRSHRTKGRYLKKSAHHAHRRHRRHRINPRFVVLLVVLLVMLIGITVVTRSCAKPTLLGRWNLDGTTIYEFGKNGKGSLVLMHAEYEFQYTVDGDLLVIDFVDEGALDSKYTFSVEKRLLFMTGGPGDAKSEYVLQRVY